MWLRKSNIEDCFLAANKNKNYQAYVKNNNPDTSLCRYEFLEIFIRIGILKYTNPKADVYCGSKLKATSTPFSIPINNLQLNSWIIQSKNVKNIKLKMDLSLEGIIYINQEYQNVQKIIIKGFKNYLMCINVGRQNRDLLL